MTPYLISPYTKPAGRRRAVGTFGAAVAAVLAAVGGSDTSTEFGGARAALRKRGKMNQGAKGKRRPAGFRTIKQVNGDSVRIEAGQLQTLTAKCVKGVAVAGGAISVLGIGLMVQSTRDEVATSWVVTVQCAPSELFCIYRPHVICLL